MTFLLVAAAMFTVFTAAAVAVWKMFPPLTIESAAVDRSPADAPPRRSPGARRVRTRVHARAHAAR